MKKQILFGFLIMVLLFASSCEWLGKEDLAFYKGIESAQFPVSCKEYEYDVCGLFDCMVDLCWCEESPDRILYEGEGIIIASEEEAISIVQTYLDEQIGKGYEEGTLYGKVQGIKVKSVSKLNNVFYNVFAEESHGNEIVYTVAVDGTIMKTICGV
ncbi:MAG: hypothetical protein ABII01_06670 [Candidatus Woesearchaeota archaeon]